MILRLFLKFIRCLASLLFKKAAEIRAVRKSKLKGYFFDRVLAVYDQPSGLQYDTDMDEQFRQIYQQFGNHFGTFSRSARIWQYLNASPTNDYKRTGGAGKLIKRSLVRGISGNRLPLPYFITNIAIPHLKLSNLELYFLPERMLIKQGGTFAAVFYKNLHITGYTTLFIEDEMVPADAQIVDRTWRLSITSI